MKKIHLMVLCVLVLALSPAFASGKEKPFSKGSVWISGQAGLNTLVRPADDFADPFDAMPFPVGAGFEFFLTDNIGIGGSIMYDKWCDYLGIFGGTWTFRLFKPALDIVYHFRTEKMGVLNLFAGASLGYSLVSVSNNLGNVYQGRMKSEPHVAPFIGINAHFLRNSPGFLGRLLITFKASWSVTGHFSDVYGMVGLTYRLR